jgi:hypothetical protein
MHLFSARFEQNRGVHRYLATLTLTTTVQTVILLMTTKDSETEVNLSYNRNYDLVTSKDFSSVFKSQVCKLEGQSTTV